ncbi:hypothetical protein HaLaN_22505 [Haematococcus lacustris]|uniref:Uncharacterized protein n=1 Tax=Haematococcus lacustris TaxID=44745 RepID=A0A699ZS00_HAELA|nr:hypothetical protein HaLaN_22505 [Haematococcus lacustris]
MGDEYNGHLQRAYKGQRFSPSIDPRKEELGAAELQLSSLQACMTAQEEEMAARWVVVAVATLAPDEETALAAMEKSMAGWEALAGEASANAAASQEREEQLLLRLLKQERQMMVGAAACVEQELWAAGTAAEADQRAVQHALHQLFVACQQLQQPPQPQPAADVEGMMLSVQWADAQVCSPAATQPSARAL